MTDQHDRDAAPITGELVEQLVQILDGGGLGAVPAAHPESRTADSGPGSAQRVPDRASHRDHPQHAWLKRSSGLDAHRPAAVHHDDRSWRVSGIGLPPALPAGGGILAGHVGWIRSLRARSSGFFSTGPWLIGIPLSS
jgi:hypothetical protein